MDELGWRRVSPVAPLLGSVSSEARHGLCVTLEPVASLRDLIGDARSTSARLAPTMSRSGHPTESRSVDTERGAANGGIFGVGALTGLPGPSHDVPTETARPTRWPLQLLCAHAQCRSPAVGSAPRIRAQARASLFDSREQPIQQSASRSSPKSPPHRIRSTNTCRRGETLQTHT
jgi:hypothetical protein